MTAAKSTDLIRWEMFSRNADTGCKLVENVQEEMSEALRYAKTTTFWAPDVQQLADGRYYLYYCTCEGSSPLSALGLAVSSRPEGPYKNLGIFLKSGGPGYDATTLPNAIDPCVFFDREGLLWMVYGSYSGGIYILRMDPETGFPLEGQGYGKKLLGKNHARIEGPYILYSPDTEYYYLFLSFGGQGQCLFVGILHRGMFETRKHILVQQHLHLPHGVLYGVGFQLALPYHYHVPPVAVQQVVVLAVALPVACYLGFPEGGVAFRHPEGGTALMAVPKAPVHEYGCAVGPHNDVRLSGHTLHIQSVAVAVVPQPLPHLQLGLGAPTVYVRHAAVPLFGCHCVGHCVCSFVRFAPHSLSWSVHYFATFCPFWRLREA